MTFVKTRNSPSNLVLADGVTVGTVVSYRSLESLDHVEVYLHTDGKYYLRAVGKDGCGLYFGPTAGYASSALAVTAMDTAVSPVLPS